MSNGFQDLEALPGNQWRLGRHEWVAGRNEAMLLFVTAASAARNMEPSLPEVTMVA